MKNSEDHMKRVQTTVSPFAPKKDMDSKEEERDEVIEDDGDNS